MSALKAEARGSVAGSRAARLLEEPHWLCPLEDLRSKGSVREGMLPGFSLGSYLLLLDYSSRLVRQGKARVSPEVAGTFDRLGSSPEIWNHRLRDECVSMEVFDNVKHAQALVASWRNDYNHRRPHSSLGYQTPAAFAAGCLASATPALRPDSRREEEQALSIPQTVLS